MDNPPAGRYASRLSLSCLLLLALLATGCTELELWDFNQNGDIELEEAFLAFLGAVRADVQTNLTFPDQFLWDSGGRAVKPPGQLRQFDVERVRIGGEGAGPAFRLRLEYRMETAPGAFPFFFKGAFDVSKATSNCWWCAGTAAWMPFRVQTAQAQGAVNAFGGPNFREDVVVFAQIDGPGRVGLRAIVGGRERQIPGSIELSGRDLRMILPMTTLAELGLVRPGIRMVFGIVGPPPESVYDRVPERGAIQLGLPGRDGVDAAMIKIRYDANGDGKEDLFYLDTTGNDLIDAVAWDLNGDGRIVFADREGPFLFVGTAGTPAEFSAIERKSAGRLQAYVASNASMWFLTVVEDRNGDGDVADSGEFRNYYIPRR